MLSTTPLASGSLASSPIPPTLPHLTPSPVPHTVSLPELSAQNPLVFTPMAIQMPETNAETPFASPMLHQPSVPSLSVSHNSYTAENAVTPPFSSHPPSCDTRGQSPITSYNSVENPVYQYNENQELYLEDQDPSSALHTTSDVKFYTPCGDVEPGQGRRSEDNQVPSESGGSIPFYDMPAVISSETNPSPDAQTQRQPDTVHDPRPLPYGTPSTQGPSPELPSTPAVGSVFPLSIPSFLNPFSVEVDAGQEVISTTDNVPVEPSSALPPEPPAPKVVFSCFVVCSFYCISQLVRLD